MATSRITIDVTTDENKVPVAMNWTAEDGGISQQVASAMVLSMWNPKEHAAMRMDLWTKDMQVNEMDRFFFQTLRAMADTYFKATQNRELAVDMQKFVQYFGEKTQILKTGDS